MSPWNSLDPLRVPSSRNNYLDTLVDGLPKTQGCDSLFCVWGMDLNASSVFPVIFPLLNAEFLFKPFLHYPLHHCKTSRPSLEGLENLLIFWSLWAYYDTSVLIFFFSLATQITVCSCEVFWRNLYTIDWTFLPHGSLLFKLP